MIRDCIKLGAMESSTSVSCSIGEKKLILDPSLCWYEITEEEHRELLEKKAREEKTLEMSSKVSEVISKSAEEAEPAMSVRSKTSTQRQIEIDILDSANVEKFEKLVRNDLAKSPFKRRLSVTSSSDEMEAGNSAKMNDDRDGGTANHLHVKRSKKHEDDHGVERLRRESSSSGSSSQTSRKQVEYETDEAVLARRQKQIDYGKNTLGYENYIQQVPRSTRTVEEPKTPPKHIKYSRRAWDGLIRVWRKQLHCYDPNAKAEDDQ